MKIDNAPVRVVSRTHREIRFVAPDSVCGKKSVSVVIERGSEILFNGDLGVEAASPGLFASDAYGKGTLRGQDKSPRKGAGQKLTFTATGLAPDLPTTVLIGGKTAEVVGSSTRDGVTTLRVRVPTGLKPRSIPVIIRSGEFTSQDGVTIEVE